MSIDRIGPRNRQLSFDECFPISREQSPKPEPPDKGREKVESLARGNRACFDSNSAIKANMARELHQMGFEVAVIGRVLHMDANQVAEWFDTALEGGKANG